VFIEPTTGWHNATETAQLTASDAGAADALGWAVRIDGGTIVATVSFATVNGNGGQRAAYVFGNLRSGSQTAAGHSFKRP
jgi:hypothetical protein